MKKLFFIVGVMGITNFCQAQDFPNSGTSSFLSPISEMAQKIGSTPVNYFTGLPQISVPLYSYNNPENGLAKSISLDYFAQGSNPTTWGSPFGIGWNLNAGGIITRTIRGIPDDNNQTGYLNADTIPNDFRNTATAYYNFEVDAEQDIFQYNFNGKTGKFFIGKNRQIIQIPMTKLKIIPIFEDGLWSKKIFEFLIITEDGKKYHFRDTDASILMRAEDMSFIDDYISTWQLSQIISSFNTDTIFFNYSNKELKREVYGSDITIMRNSDGLKTTRNAGFATSDMNYKTLTSIEFPGKTSIHFEKSGISIFNSANKDQTPEFKKGYKLIFWDSINYHDKGLFLKKIIPYTQSERGEEYSFDYYIDSITPPVRTQGLWTNSQDYWGFYNGAVNDSGMIPPFNSYPGADRNPDVDFAIYRNLKYLNLPGGGIINYQYELNDHFPYKKTFNRFVAKPSESFIAIIELNQVFNTKNRIVFTLDSTVNRQGPPPITGTGNITFNIMNVTGTVIKSAITFSLYDLYYKGMVIWDFDLPNGDYELHKIFPSGTTVTGNFPIIIKYETRFRDISKMSVKSGGLRIKRIISRNNIHDSLGVIEEYRYVNEDGTSSGFYGDITKYDYPYQETKNNVKTNYTVINSNPQISENRPLAGYARVEVYKGSIARNLGKYIYEFTSPFDTHITMSTSSTFPYIPDDDRTWAIGLIKRISLKDSSGNIVQKTTHDYGFDSMKFVNKNFKSVKLGNSSKVKNTGSTPDEYTFIGHEYYPSTGRTYINSSTDTLYQNDGTINTSYTFYTYDTNYNVIKVKTGYDKTRSLELEKRIYYPYNYTVSGGIKKLKDSGIINTVIAIENWIIGDGNPRIISGNIKDFKIIGNGNVKPSVVYQLQTNRPLNLATIGAFNAASLNRKPSYFIPQTNFQLYDNNQLTEYNTANSGISHSILYDYNKQFPIAKISNAKLQDIAYTSFEADGMGNWTVSSSLRDSLNSVTGTLSYNLSNGNISKNNISNSKTYLITVWAKSGVTLKINSEIQSSPIDSQGEWKLYAKKITGVNSITVSGSGLIDELRLHPATANMITNTYEPFIGITSTADANNTIKYFEYDGLNRLKAERDKDRNILKVYEYSDSVMAINLEPKWVFYNTNCSYKDGIRDSLFRDENIYSSAYGSTKGTESEDLCNCSFVPLPEYKVINGVCEKSTIKCYTVSVYVKIMTGPEAYYYAWVNKWQYKWSDGSVGPEYTEEESTSRPLGCKTIRPPLEEL